MAKILKLLRIGNSILFELLLAFLIVFAFLVRTSPVQTKLAQIASSYFSDELKTTFKVSRVSIVFFNKIALDGVTIKDRQHKNIAQFESLLLTLKSINNIKKEIRFKKLEIKGGDFNLYQAKTTGAFNFDFIIDYFSSPDASKDGNPYSLKIDKLSLINVNARYDDYNFKNFRDEINYDHVELKKLYVFANDFSYKNGVLRASIHQLSLHERCGLKIKQFSCYAKISDKGIVTKQLRFKTNQSTAYLPKFAMYFSKWHDFYYFDDKVFFDAQLEKSYIAMKDIQYFASELGGMEQFCVISASSVTDCLKKMNIKNVDLSFGKGTQIKGDIVLPDFRYLHNLAYYNVLETAEINMDDIEEFGFPIVSGLTKIDLHPYVKNLKKVKFNQLSITGTNQHCLINSKKIETPLGNLSLKKELIIDYISGNDTYKFNTSLKNNQSIVIDSFNVGKLIQQKNIGKVSGSISLNGLFDFNSIFQIDTLKSKINTFNFHNYNYKNITLNSFSFKDNTIKLNAEIEDENLTAKFETAAKFSSKNEIKLSTECKLINPTALGFTNQPNTSISGEFDCDFEDITSSHLLGQLVGHNLKIIQNENTFVLQDFDFNSSNINGIYNYTLNSSILNAELIGKINLNEIYNDYKIYAQQILTNYPISTSKKIVNDFKFEFEFQKTNELIKLLKLPIYISNKTSLKGVLSDNNCHIALNSKEIKLPKIQFQNISFNAGITNKSFSSDLRIKKTTLFDSLEINAIVLSSEGKNNTIANTLDFKSIHDQKSELKFNLESPNPSIFKAIIAPSSFYLNKNKWEINQIATIEFTSGNFFINNLLAQHNKESIEINGDLASTSTPAFININQFQLNNLNFLFDKSSQLEGILTTSAEIKNLKENLSIACNASVENLVFNKEKIGTIDTHADWNYQTQKMNLNGKMDYKNIPSFNFDGFIFTNTEKNIHLSLYLQHTDLHFSNSFIDQSILSNVQGEISGEINLTGTLYNPEIQGKVSVLNGKVKSEDFGTWFSINGDIDINKNGFYADNIPFTDEEGHTGSLIATIYHDNFTNWNYDINIQTLENISFQNGIRTLNDKFLLLNTRFTEDEVYFGKVYATGEININGTTENANVTTDLSTNTGSLISIPMYGATNYEESNFIEFISNKVKDTLKTKSNYSQFDLNLDLKFHVTPSTQVKLIFNERTGDEIIAYGNGDISIKMDPSGKISMNGLYTIKNDKTNQSTYTFVLGPIKQNFNIQEEGTISWSGDPYEALLDLTTYYTVTTNLKDILPAESTNSQTMQAVKCKLKLQETIKQPKIAFEFELPSAGTGINDDAKAAISRINTNKDELNKQFISLFLWKKFQPLLSSSTSVGTNAVADLVSSQINSILGDLSKEYKLNLTYNTASNNLTTQGNQDINNTQNADKIAIGVSKNFFDGKLIVNGTIGRASVTSLNTPQSILISNFNLEYKLTKKGNLSINGFNETNDLNTSIQLNSLNTQGIGLSYKNDFSSLNDFELYQGFLDIFRKKDKKRIMKPNRTNLQPIPKKSSPNTKTPSPTATVK